MAGNDRYIFTVGGMWQDDTGSAELIALVNVKRKGEFAVMQRITPKISNPFIVSTRELLRGLDGWRRIYSDGDSEDDRRVVEQARKLYDKFTSNDPSIHCNRFRAWDELSYAERKVWVRKALKEGCARG